MHLHQVDNNKELMLLQCISGSRAYGLNTPESDTDIKGVFFMPKRLFYSMHYTPQVANETNDVVYYEIKRFIELLTKNNPNILELLSTPDDSILYKHPLMALIKPDLFLSKLCEASFAGYAQSQIQKATGLNKKIFNPVDEVRKTVLDFCVVIEGYKSVLIKDWLQSRGYTEDECGLAKIPHAKNAYAIFHRSKTASQLNGIISDAGANDVSLSSVEDGAIPSGTLFFNKEGYSTHCRNYREYWDWVDKRNNARFKNTLAHGKNYDAKNMMHTFRLLNMAEEIAREHQINVRRHDRDFLLDIKHGKYQYDELLKMANDKIEKIKRSFANSGLPDQPDEDAANKLLVTIRERLYDEI